MKKSENKKQQDSSESQQSFIEKIISGEFSAFNKFRKNKDKSENKLTSKDMNIFWFLKFVIRGACLIIFNFATASYFAFLLINKTGNVEGGIALFIGILIILWGIVYLFHRIRKKQLERKWEKWKN